MDTVPSSLIRAILKPFGARLYRKPKIEYKPPKYLSENYRGGSLRTWHGVPHYGPNPSGSVYDGSSSALCRLTDYSDDRVKDSDYYYFFGPINSVSNWSRCRVCRQTIWTKYGRQVHLQGTMHCPQFHSEALALLRKDQKKRCVVCDKELFNMKEATYRYGVMLCDKNCLFDWMHEDEEAASQRVYREALRLVGWKELLPD